MFKTCLVWLALIGATCSAPMPKNELDPLDLIRQWGYNPTSVDATTQDGYILTLYRIQNGRNGPATTTPAPPTPTPVARPVVLFLHGFETSAADWLINQPNQSAPFIFADGGFDVFVGSFRGSKYGRNHKTWDPSTDIFWQFSWDEMAKYDLPSMIDTVIQTSKAKQVYLVAHSTGTTAAWATMTQNTQTLQKIKQVHALAPLVTLQHVQGPLKFAAPFMSDINIAGALFGVDEFKPNPDLQESWAKYVCKDPTTDLTCQNQLLMLAGPNTRQIDQSQIDLINQYQPGGVSVRTAVHLAQMIMSGQFQAYDFGNTKLNQQHYGRTTPPLYNLASITTQVPTFLYSSECDWIAEPNDVSNAAAMLSRMLVTSEVLPSFNHMDFIWGTRAAGEIYEPIMAAIAQDFLAPTTHSP